MQIGILAYEGAQMSAVLGLADVFLVATRIGAPLGGVGFETTVLAQADLSKGGFDVVIVPPSLSGARGAGETEVHAWLQKQALGGLLCSVCAGAFWLGHAGLLDARPVTTHWALEVEFIRAFPAAQLASEHMLIDDGNLITAGGVMAWVDLGLHLVERFAGGEIMTRTARHLLVDPPRRAQSHYQRFEPAMAHGDANILAVQRWLEGQIGDAVSVGQMAARASCSPRSLLRRFKVATGFSPMQYVQRLRIERARGELERGRLPVSEIGYRLGYQDSSAFIRVFRQITGLSPAAYRKRFYCG